MFEYTLIHMYTNDTLALGTPRIYRGGAAPQSRWRTYRSADSPAPSGLGDRWARRGLAGLGGRWEGLGAVIFL